MARRYTWRRGLSSKEEVYIMPGGIMATIASPARPTDVVAGLLEARLSGSDSVKVEDAIGEFFGAYNSMNYERCMDYVAQLAGGDGGVPGFLRVVRKGLLKEARNTTGPVVIQRVGRIEIVYLRATAILRVVLQGEVRKKRVNLVKQGGSWKLDWDSIADPCVLTALRRIKGEA
jgi:hypothetical protein